MRYFEAVPDGLGATALAKLHIAQILLQVRKDVRGAKAAYEAAAMVDPNSYAASVGLAFIAGIENRTEDFVAHWKRAAEIRPRAIAGWLGQAQGLKKLKRIDEARAALKRALSIDPNEPAALALQKELGGP
jgi:tetratricopeptide (TPR) repeat protein